MQRTIFSDRFPVTLSSVTKTRGKLQQALIASKIENSLVSKILLAFSESSTNIILHNNAIEPVLISFSQYQQEYHLAIMDDGFSWNPTTYNALKRISSPYTRITGEA